MRSPDSGIDVTALTLCHEFGHLLAGPPFQRLNNNQIDDWSSSEGQSDWFAAKECMPLVFEKFKEKIDLLESVGEAKIFCEKSEKRKMCEFITMAGLKFSKLNYKYFK